MNETYKYTCKNGGQFVDRVEIKFALNEGTTLEELFPEVRDVQIWKRVLGSCYKWLLKEQLMSEQDFLKAVLFLSFEGKMISKENIKQYSKIDKKLLNKRYADSMNKARSTRRSR